MQDFKLSNKNFVLACLATFFYFGSFYLTLPIIPQFVITLGGSTAQVGVVIGFMMLTSVLVRPYFGKASDKHGRKPIMLLGSSVFTVLFIGYLCVQNLDYLYIIRIAQGVAHGAMLAAMFAFVADMAPKERRGEVMGIHGVSNVVAMALFPAVGSEILVRTHDFTELFILSSLLCLIACLCVCFIDNQKPSLEKKAHVSMAKVFIQPPVCVAALTFLGASILYGTVIAFLPIYGPQRSVENIGLFFTVYAVFTFVSRLAAGKLSDRHGRTIIIIPAMALVALGGFVLVFLDGIGILALAGACFGLGFGGFMPALNAFVVDHTVASDRSTALAIYTSFMDIGMSIGSIGFGIIGELLGYSSMFIIAAIVTCCSTVLFCWYIYAHK